MREGGRVWAVGYDVMLEECDAIVIRDADNEQVVGNLLFV